MATKLGRVVTYHDGLSPRTFNHVVLRHILTNYNHYNSNHLVLQKHVTNENYCISTTGVRMVTIKSYYFLIIWSYEIT